MSCFLMLNLAGSKARSELLGLQYTTLARPRLNLWMAHVSAVLAVFFSTGLVVVEAGCTYLGFADGKLNLSCPFLGSRLQSIAYTSIWDGSLQHRL